MSRFIDHFILSPESGNGVPYSTIDSGTLVITHPEGDVSFNAPLQILPDGLRYFVVNQTFPHDDGYKFDVTIVANINGTVCESGFVIEEPYTVPPPPEEPQAEFCGADATNSGNAGILDRKIEIDFNGYLVVNFDAKTQLDKLELLVQVNSTNQSKYPGSTIGEYVVIGSTHRTIEDPEAVPPDPNTGIYAIDNSNSNISTPGTNIESFTFEIDPDSGYLQRGIDTNALDSHLSINEPTDDVSVYYVGGARAGVSRENFFQTKFGESFSSKFNDNEVSQLVWGQVSENDTILIRTSGAQNTAWDYSSYCIVEEPSTPQPSNPCQFNEIVNGNNDNGQSGFYTTHIISDIQPDGGIGNSTGIGNVHTPDVYDPTFSNTKYHRRLKIRFNGERDPGCCVTIVLSDIEGVTPAFYYRVSMLNNNGNLFNQFGFGGSNPPCKEVVGTGEILRFPLRSIDPFADSLAPNDRDYTLTLDILFENDFNSTACTQTNDPAGLSLFIFEQSLTQNC